MDDVEKRAVELLSELDTAAREVDHYEYGLPIHGDDMPRMVALVATAIRGAVKERDFEWWEACTLVDNVEPTPEGVKDWLAVYQDYCNGEAVAAEKERADNFEMMCRRLVRKVPEGQLRDQAMDLLQRLGKPDAFLREAEAVAATKPAPQWARTPPSTPGWWWYRGELTRGNVTMMRIGTGDPSWGTLMGSISQPMVDYKGEWCGPIEPPE